MTPRLRRILWMLVVASLGLSGLSACSFQSLFGAGAGLGFAGFVAVLLLLAGTTTQTGCGPCLNMPMHGNDVCLSMLPPRDAGPCLSPDRQVYEPLDVCLSIDPDADTPDAGVGACLAPEPPDATTDARDPSKPADRMLASSDRRQVLESLQDRLPDDVKDRLGLRPGWRPGSPKV